MKTYIIKLIYLLLIPVFMLTAAFGDIFDSTRANVWVIDGEISQSFSIDDWSTAAFLSGGSVNITTEDSTDIPISGISLNHIVIVNNVMLSAPNTSAGIPILSFSGLSTSSNSDLDNNQASISISPDGGEFNKTIEVSFTLNAPKSKEYELFYAINEAEQPPRILMAEAGKNSYSIFLVKANEYTIEYGIKTSSNGFKVSHFTISNDKPNRDSDGDGIPDHIEVELGLNPLDGKIPDSDNDGWNDFDEYIRGTDSTLESSSPLDSDGDGWSDFDENLRGTDPLNSQICIDKPTATALYGVEYLVNSNAYLGEDNSSTKLSDIQAISLINLQATSYFDSVKIMNEANSTLDFNKTLCHISTTDLNSSMTLGNTPIMRASADIPLISRVVGSSGSSVGGYVIKTFLLSSPSSTLKEYFLSDTFSQLSSSDYNATAFKDSYITYLEETLVQTREVNIHQNSSIRVGLLESTFRSRVDTNSTLYLGNPTIPMVHNAYANTLKSISSEDRSFNALYSDVISVIENKSPTLFSSLLPLFDTPTNDINDTERILATHLQKNLTEQENYYLSLMTIISLETAESNSTVFAPSLDTDKDGINNKEEVFSVDYTHPLRADSDGDGVTDADDLCPQDNTNTCLNDGFATNDTDGDGMADTIDNCPFDLNTDQNDTDGDGIGDTCAEKGIVIISPRTNMHLFKGKTFNFAAVLFDTNKTPIWSVNQEVITNTQNQLSYTHTFATLGEHLVCVGFLGKEALSCVNMSILDRNIDNDLAIYTYDITEGDSGTKNLLVEVVLKHPSKSKVIYAYHTEDGTATEDKDYVPQSATLTFDEGDMRQYITISILGDTTKEDNETFEIVVNDTYAKTITIIDDDTSTTPPVDTTPPIITILGENPMYLNVGELYLEKNATAFDAIDGNVDVNISGMVDTNTSGNYNVVYKAEDSSGNEANATRTVIVQSISPHDIAIEKIKAFAAINGDAPAPTVQDYIDAGITGIDASNLTEMNEVVQNLDANEVDTTEELQALADAIGSSVDTDAPVFTSANTASVNENQTSAITLVATDNSTVTYSISGTDTGSFTVDGGTGVVTFNVAPDFELQTSYSFTATATDEATNSTSQDVTIMILDVNEPSTFFVVSDSNFSGVPTSPKGTMDNNGNALIIWEQKVPDSIYASHYVTALGWGKQVLIDGNVSAFKRSSKLVMNTHGDAFVTWEQSVGGSVYQVWTNHYTVGQGWQGAVRLDTNTKGSHSSDIAISENGEAIVIWVTGSTVKSSKFTSTEGWSVPSLVNPQNNKFPYNCKISIDSNGNGIALWGQVKYAPDNESNVWTNRYTQNMGWGTAITLAEINNVSVKTGSFDIAMNAAGNAISLWQPDNNFGSSVLLSNRYDVTTGWIGNEQLILGHSNNAKDPAIRIDNKGNALALWREYSTSSVIKEHVWAQYYDADNNTWSTSKQLDTATNHNTDSPRISINPNGEIAIVWRQENNKNKNDIWIIKYNPLTGWNTASIIGESVANTSHAPDVSINDSGKGIIVWRALGLGIVVYHF